jgi:hypothetical protein
MSPEFNHEVSASVGQEKMSVIGELPSNVREMIEQGATLDEIKSHFDQSNNRYNELMAAAEEK